MNVNKLLKVAETFKRMAQSPSFTTSGADPKSIIFQAIGKLLPMMISADPEANKHSWTITTSYSITSSNGKNYDAGIVSFKAFPDNPNKPKDDRMSDLINKKFANQIIKILINAFNKDPLPVDPDGKPMPRKPISKEDLEIMTI